MASRLNAGPGVPGYNKFYAAPALDTNGKTIWIGTFFGLSKVQLAK